MDLRTAGWDNLFLVTAVFLLLEPALVASAVAISTEPVVGMTLVLKIGLLQPQMYKKEGGNEIGRDLGSVNILGLSWFRQGSTNNP